MDADLLSQITAFFNVVMIDLVLAGDNAIVVGMAAASVPLEHRRKVVIWGTVAAVVLRIAFALVTTYLLAIIGLTLAGGILLAYVCWDMYQELRHKHYSDHPDGMPGGDQANNGQSNKTVMAAVWQVAMADLSMSLDNVLAVAGAAKDHKEILVLGLLLSVVLMAFAANYVAGLIHKHRWLAWLGLAVITYVAVNMIYRGGLQVAHAL